MVAESGKKKSLSNDGGDKQGSSVKRETNGADLRPQSEP